MAASDMVRVREAGPADVAAVARVLEAAFAPLRDLYTPAAYAATVPDESTLRSRLAHATTWLATLDGACVGTITARPTPTGVYLQSMAVTPAARGRGVGGRLLDEALRSGQATGAARVHLSTTPFLHDAIRLYQAAGFRFVPEGPHDLHGTTLLSMELRWVPAP